MIEIKLPNYISVEALKQALLIKNIKDDKGENIDISALLGNNEPKTHLLAYTKILSEALYRKLGMTNSSLEAIDEHAKFLVEDRSAKKVAWHEYAGAIAAGLSDDEVQKIAATAQRYYRYRVTQDHVLRPQVNVRGIEGDMTSKREDTEWEEYAQCYFKGLEKGLNATAAHEIPWDVWPDGSRVSGLYTPTTVDEKAIVVMSALLVFGLTVADERLAQEIITCGYREIMSVGRRLSGRDEAIPHTPYNPSIGARLRRA